MWTHPSVERLSVQRGPPFLLRLVSFGQCLTSFSLVLAKASFQTITFSLAASYPATPPLGLLCLPLVCKGFRDQKPDQKC